MGAVPLQQMTEEEYLLFEEQAETRHEYYQGEIFAMAGGSIVHAQVSGNALGELHSRLKGKRCQVFPESLRIQIEAAGLYTYPDLSIVCGDVTRYKNRKDTITSPVVLIEVLSPDTESYDRGEKFDFYRQIPSLEEYIMIASTRMKVEHFRRQPTGQWLLTVYDKPEEELLIESISESIPLSELYDRVGVFQ